MFRQLPRLAPRAGAARPTQLRSLAVTSHCLPQPVSFGARPRTFHTRSRLSVQATTPPSAEAATPTSSTSTGSTSYTDGGPTLPGVSTDTKSRSVYITWASGITSKFHTLWLRDHCRCPSCYHPTTKQRLLNTFEVNPESEPLHTESTTEGLLVHWPLLPSERGEGVGEGEFHASVYPWRWLMRNSYAPVLSPAEETGKTLDKVLWGKGIGSSPPTVKYDDVMGSDEGVLRWLTKVAQYGFAFVSGVPPTPTDTEALVRRIAFIRETHYGGFWDFTSDLAHGDTAYTDLALQAHTDTTYFTDPAGLQLFHLLSHTASKTASSSATKGPSGGSSLLIDGFLAAAVLKDVHPSAYQTLSTVRIRTHSAGDPHTMIRPLLDSGYPILDHDPTTGELTMVRYNNDDRSVLRVSDDEVEPFYDALRKWHEILTNPEGEYWVQLKPGTAMIFDNHRVLHGRSAFVGNRRLCGAYVNHDDYRSRLSVLRAQEAEGRSERGVWDDGL
ncbi:Taurine catabolism dioxygenase TauD/TfdA [Kalmanozyma brasiliensis GHG001]|uniref:Taurine catabolism dioxygenase TauD/TfdA n=1 Tax=Kalmanozyma brasiliensis (strain GHG001) TaxID=1365824 RepID=UPI001CEBA291|nr:Taurine catabolism dioxygenase TauD/TfdA [Kalmanozyma brasiliensis GHG001]KAF6767587.1 Taurine catabolism dioxygenase TauD/TfdA [Kalmanozyma brasiliensis GHG001]